MKKHFDDLASSQLIRDSKNKNQSENKSYFAKSVDETPKKTNKFLNFVELEEISEVPSVSGIKDSQLGKKRYIKQPSCRCKKSKCLLMYCDCFLGGQDCSDLCSCLNCRNNAKFKKEKQKAVAKVSKRNSSSKKSGNSSTDETVVCNCTRSNCMKNYCDCFKSGRGCSVACRCVVCLNDKPAIPISSFNQAQFCYSWIRIKIVNKKIEVDCNSD